MDLTTLKRFLINKCNPDEAHQLITWIHSDAARQVIEQELIAYEDEDLAVNSKKIFNNILIKIKEKESQNAFEGALGKTDQDENEKPGFRRILSIAASIVILIGVGIFFNQIDSFQSQDVATYTSDDVYVTKSTDLGQKLTVQLNDGTLVRLNAGSRISYNTADQLNRIVELEGEAFFDVVRDESRPFIVKVKNMQVRVLGTSFNIKTDQSENIGIVAVKSGKVEVKNIQSGLIVMLDKNEVGKVTGNENILKSQINNQEVIFGWADNKLVFNNSNVQEVIRKITKWFGYQFEVKIDVNALDNFTGVYENPTLKEVLESLSYSYKFDYEITDNKIVIK